MFRAKEGSLQEDPKYPADLKELGFFVNDIGQIRMIEYPDKDYQYQFSNNERHNVIRREAMQVCQRNEVDRRLSALGLEKLYVPQLTTVKPEGEASTAILSPPPDVLKKKKRVIVLVNDSSQDLGILTYRRLQRDLGVNGGSVVDFAKEIFTRSKADEHEGTGNRKHADISKDGAQISDREDIPALIVMNCGQLLYSYKLGNSLTTRSWMALPRKSIFHEPVQITAENHIKGNYDAKEHIQFVIKNVIENDNFVAKQAEVYVIGIENGAETLLEILGQDLDTYGSRITAMAIVNPFMTGSNITNPNLKNFLHQRARQWKVASGATDPRECIEVPHHYAQDDLEILDSSKEGPINWLENISPLSANIDISKNSSCFKASNENASAEGLDERYDMDPICATFAGGSDNPTGAGECVFTNRAVQHCILEFFEEVAHKPNGFRNPTFIAARSDPTGWGEEGDAAYQPLRLVEISPERTELEEKRKHLANMREALLFIPNYDPDLYMGRNNLQKRISELEEDVFRLQKKAHLGGGLKSGEVKDMTDHWSPEKQGPLISFAGVLVDSELVKGAGLEETVEEELMKLGGSN